MATAILNRDEIKSLIFLMQEDIDFMLPYRSMDPADYEAVYDLLRSNSRAHEIAIRACEHRFPETAAAFPDHMLSLELPQDEAGRLNKIRTVVDGLLFNPFEEEIPSEISVILQKMHNDMEKVDNDPEYKEIVYRQLPDGDRFQHELSTRIVTELAGKSTLTSGDYKAIVGAKFRDVLKTDIAPTAILRVFADDESSTKSIINEIFEDDYLPYYQQIVSAQRQARSKASLN